MEDAVIKNLPIEVQFRTTEYHIKGRMWYIAS